MRLVLASDTHNLHWQLNVPDGDVFVHAGDLTMSGGVEELKDAALWMRQLPHKRKVFIAGNHDFGLQHFMTEGREDIVRDIFDGCDYLRDSGVEIDGVNFYGSPWQPWFYDWAFNLPRGSELAEKWSMIPADTDVLVTHGPPYGILDQCPNGKVGCYDLFCAVAKVSPKVHVFGHIHEAYGHVSRQSGSPKFYNASVVNSSYKVANSPWIVEVDN